MHWPLTLLAKGPHRLASEHLRWRRVDSPGQQLHVIVLDGSGSMRRHGGFAAARALAQGLVRQAARQREQVALLALTGGRVLQLALPQPARRALVERLTGLGSGGGTPVAEALALAGRWIGRACREQPALQTTLWLMTDGRTLETPQPPTTAAHVVIIDFDRRPSRAPGRASHWAAAWGAHYIPPALSAP